MRIKLTFDPIRPNPIQIVLNGASVHESAGVEYKTGS